MPLLENESTKEGSVVIDWRWYACYAVLTLMGIALLALLIKGLIDSGDTEVSESSGWPMN